MKKTDASWSLPALGVSLALSLAVIGWGMMTLEGLTLSRLFHRLAFPLIRLLVFITIGLIAGQVIEATGWTRRLSVVARPLFRFSRIGDYGATAFTTSFFSGVAANAMLWEFYKESKITRRQLFLANLMNQIPAFFLHLPTTFFIVVPLTGWAGIGYFLLTFIALGIRTIGVALYGRLRCRPAQDETMGPPEPAPSAASARKSPKDILIGIKKRLPRRILRIGVYVVPIYVIVFMVNAMGGFDAARQWMAGFVTTRILPVESLSVVVFSFAAEFTSGFAAAGALMDAGVLSARETVIALLAGNVVAFPIRALRHQLPHYMGIFSPSMGLKLLLLGQVLRVLSLVFVGWIYFLFF